MNRHRFQQALYALLCLGALLGSAAAADRPETPTPRWSGTINQVDAADEQIMINRRTFRLPAKTPVYFKKVRYLTSALQKGMVVNFGFGPATGADGLREIQVIMIVSGGEDLTNH